jgi:ribosomal protein S18 acetylase RimI-like enzyme
MRIRTAEHDDARSLVTLAALVVGQPRAAQLVRAHVERNELLIADEHGEVVGCLAYRTDWFGCTFVSLVVVAESARRRGVARALFEAVERRSPSPRLFSSTEETNVASIRMHRALGFSASGYIDNLPQGYRELLFYKRLRP